MPENTSDCRYGEALFKLPTPIGQRSRLEEYYGTKKHSIYLRCARSRRMYKYPPDFCSSRSRFEIVGPDRLILVRTEEGYRPF